MFGNFNNQNIISRDILVFSHIEDKKEVSQEFDNLNNFIRKRNNKIRRSSVHSIKEKHINLEQEYFKREVNFKLQNCSENSVSFTQSMN